jgi:hypothetical protein
LSFIDPAIVLTIFIFSFSEPAIVLSIFKYKYGQYNSRVNE